MTSVATDTKERILQAAYRLFYRQGFARTSVDAIAEATGVTKRTVYYHFASKDDIVAAVLEVQHAQLLQQYETWLGPGSSTAPEIVGDVFARLTSWAEGPDWLGSGFSRVAAELADMRGHPGRLAARRHKAAVEHWLVERFAATGVSDASVLARQIMILIEGSMGLALIHGDSSYFEAASEAAKRLAGAQSES